MRLILLFLCCWIGTRAICMRQAMTCCSAVVKHPTSGDDRNICDVVRYAIETAHKELFQSKSQDCIAAYSNARCILALPNCQYKGYPVCHDWYDHVKNLCEFDDEHMRTLLLDTDNFVHENCRPFLGHKTQNECFKQRKYQYDGKCFECIADSHCGMNQYCDKTKHKCGNLNLGRLGQWCRAVQVEELSPDNLEAFCGEAVYNAHTLKYEARWKGACLGGICRRCDLLDREIHLGTSYTCLNHHYATEVDTTQSVTGFSTNSQSILLLLIFLLLLIVALAYVLQAARFILAKLDEQHTGTGAGATGDMSVPGSVYQGSVQQTERTPLAVSA
eukprot:gnl/Trimastix_PCT/4362.p1 GENE.gnl/Trimastix_PCT/4362~~gnl/Trimastix_PCT/4362.p1  ORF type:complete len:331 (-),score=53.63 gnl/Trimastix_PCT/4362:116-1108(-)